MTAFEEAVAQWAAAHRILITKADVVSDERLQRAEGEAAALNPLAEIIATRDREGAVISAFAKLPRIPALFQYPRRTRDGVHPRVSICLARPIAALTYEDLAAWLDNLAGTLGERLLRLKGLVRVVEHENPMLVQSVGTVFSAPRPFGLRGPAEACFLVLIVRDLERGELETVPPHGRFDISESLRPASSDALKVERV